MSDPETPEKGSRFEFRKKVDSDWKRKIQAEKERLARGGAPDAPAAVPPPQAGRPAAKPEAPPSSSAPPPPEAPRPSRAPQGVDMGFVAIVQQLADQAAVFLGLVPGYERNCDQALAAIEMLRSLKDKTEGNLSAEEAKALTGVLYELQMRYVQSCGGGGPAPAP